MEVEIKNLEKDPENPRLKDDEEYVNALAKSIKGHCKIRHKPLIRQKIGSQDIFWVFDGWSRVEAAKKLSMKTIDCDLLDRNEKSIHLELATEDVFKKSYNHWERGELYSKILKEQDMSEREYAKRFGLSQTMVSQCIKIHDKIPEARAMVISSKSSYRIWTAVADLTEENQKKIETMMDGSNITEKEVLAVIHNSQHIEEVAKNPNRSEEANQKILDEFRDKLYTYQVPAPIAANHRITELEGGNQDLTEIEVPFNGETEEYMQGFAKRLGGIYIDHKNYWVLEVDKVLYEEAMHETELEELRAQEAERKKKEKEDVLKRTNDKVSNC